MLPLEHPDRIHVAFDDHRLVANAGLLLPVTLAHHLGLGELVDCHVDLGDAPGRANAGDKMLTLVASALAGGTARVLGCVVKAPSTLGTFLRSFRWSHARQLDRVSRELLARAWAAGAGPGDGPLTIDLDSTLCETYGLCKEGARHHGYTGQRGYHPILAVAAGTGDVLMARLREGRANTARGAAHFLRETVGRVRYAGARGQLTVRADSGFYTHAIVAACRKMKVRFSITVRQHQGLRNLIEAIPEGDWTPIPYWMEGAADVAEKEPSPVSRWGTSGWMIMWSGAGMIRSASACRSTKVTLPSKACSTAQCWAGSACSRRRESGIVSSVKKSDPPLRTKPEGRRSMAIGKPP